ncbi:CBS domain protein [compost metagenome]
MSTDPKLASPDERFADAEARIHAARIGALVVKDDSGRVVGILQIHDLATDEPSV